MEALDRAFERESRRTTNTPFDPPTVKTMNDIKRVLAEFDPHQSAAQVVPVNAAVPVGVDGRTTTFNLSTKTQSKSKRDLIIEGLQLVKKRIESADLVNSHETIEVNGVVMPSAKIGNGALGVTWVDQFIKRWMGAYRDGLMICWNLDGIVYKYNIFEHKLVKVTE